MKALIFGMGQDGHYLRKLCQDKGYQTICASRSRGTISNVNELIGECGNVDNVMWVHELIADTKPDLIFHLAANSSTRHTATYENYQTIVGGTINILEAVKTHKPMAKVFITGSGLQFKNDGKAIAEWHEFEANSQYSAARIASINYARYYRSLGIRIYVGYLFHHESELRKSSSVSMIIINGIRDILAGRQQELVIGDLSVRKEWGFSGDIVEGIMALVEQEKVFEATIGTGYTYSIEDWVQTCFDKFNLDWKKYVKVVDKFTPEYRILYSDTTTINELGWHAKTTLNQLCEIMTKSQQTSIQ